MTTTKLDKGFDDLIWEVGTKNQITVEWQDGDKEGELQCEAQLILRDGREGIAVTTEVNGEKHATAYLIPDPNDPDEMNWSPTSSVPEEDREHESAKTIYDLCAHGLATVLLDKGVL